MSPLRRILTALSILVGLSILVLAVEYGRGFLMQSEAEILDSAAPGSVPLYMNGSLVTAFSAGDLALLTQLSFVDEEEGKTQTGWLLADILRKYLPEQALLADTRVLISSATRKKSVDLSWQQVTDPDLMVMFTLSGKGTLKLVSKMPALATRDEWIQDTDKIEVFEP